MDIVKRNFRNFIISDFFVQFGSGMTLIAVSWYIKDITGSNYNVGLFFSINAACGIIMSFLSGLIIDRIDKRNLMIWINIFRMLALMLSIFLIQINGFHLFYVLLIAMGNGFGWNIYLPVSKSIIPSITRKGNLMKTNSIAEIAMQVGLFSSGALAGILYKVIGFHTILYINSLCFVFAILFMCHVKLQKEDGDNSEQTISPVQQFFGGVMYLFREKYIFLLGLVMYVPFIGAICINVSLPGYVQDILQRDSTAYGIIDMFYGVGACFSGFLMILLSRKYKQRYLVYSCYAVAIVLALILTFNTSIIITSLIIALFGICGPGIRIVLNTEIMSVVPTSLLGRAMSVWNTLQLLLQLMLSNTIGVVMDKMGAQYGFSIYAIVMFAGLLLYLRAIRRNSISAPDYRKTGELFG